MKRLLDYLPYLLLLLIPAAFFFYWKRRGSAVESYVPPFISNLGPIMILDPDSNVFGGGPSRGDGSGNVVRPGANNGPSRPIVPIVPIAPSTCLGPRNVPFRDYVDMRYLDDAGRSLSAPGRIDGLRGKMAFFVSNSSNVCQFKVGMPIKITAHSSVTNPIFRTGIYEISGIIPGIPGHHTDEWGKWIVTTSIPVMGIYRPGIISAPQNGMLQAL